MPITPLSQRLAVCSWSLQPTDPRNLLQQVQVTGLQRVQLALDPLRENPQTWGNAVQLLQQNHIAVVSGMFGCVGEDYSTLESIRVTGGVAPDATWEENLENISATAALARKLDIKLVSFHAGFLPHDPMDPNYTKMHHRLTMIADIFAAEDVDLAFETGQENAPALLAFLQKLQRKNVGVNFDPANMILYDQGEPIEALRVLASWLKQVHIKDAIKTKQGGTWGEEVPVGSGQVDWRAFFGVLREIAFAGYCCIEREAGQQRLVDIQTARRIVESLPL